MLLFPISIAISVALSAFVAVEMGIESYAPLAVIATIALYILFAANESAHRRREKLRIESPRPAIDILVHLAIALYLGWTWPSMPFIVWLGRWTRGDESPRGPSSSSAPHSRSE